MQQVTFFFFFIIFPFLQYFYVPSPVAQDYSGITQALLYLIKRILIKWLHQLVPF